MTPPHLTVAVVVCAYTMDRFDDVRKTVASVCAQRRPAEYVVVAVDHNGQLHDRLRDVLPARVILVLNEGGRGLSTTRNVGSQAVHSDIVAYIDDDAAAEEDWLGALAGPFADASVMAVGGRIDPAWPDAERPGWLAPEFDWVVACTYRGMAVSSDNETRNVIGCNMALRRSALEKVGWFNPGLGRVGKITGQAEETELCLRIRREIPGARILYAPGAVVHHKVPRGRLTIPFLLKRSYNEGFFKARMQQVSPPEEDALETETAYLKHLVQSFFPAQLKRIYSPPALARLSAGILSVGAVGAGVLMARLRPEA